MDVNGLIVNLFNLVLKTGLIPEQCGIGIVMPLYKNKGFVSNPGGSGGLSKQMKATHDKGS